MKTVGTRQNPEMTLHASGQALERAARFAQALSALGCKAVAPKGVRRFKTHEQANQDWDAGLALCMAAQRLERR